VISLSPFFFICCFVIILLFVIPLQEISYLMQSHKSKSQKSKKEKTGKPAEATSRVGGGAQNSNKKIEFGPHGL